MLEPRIKRASFFVDGQNLFHSTRNAFGYTYPNYDVLKLSEKICELKNWQKANISFYTGIPDVKIERNWHIFWTRKMAVMKTAMGIKTFSRKLQYTKITGDYSKPSFIRKEKGVDIRIALDVIRAIFDNECDVVVIFSQDQDLSEVAKEVRDIAKKRNRWLKIASAFPVSPSYKNNRGIDSTDWIKIEREMYDQCIDTRDYRPKGGDLPNVS